jgi:hypothetical protein
VRAIQRTQFRAKNVKNDLNLTYLVKQNFCFETEGVCGGDFHSLGYLSVQGLAMAFQLSLISFVPIQGYTRFPHPH